MMRSRPVTLECSQMTDIDARPGVSSRAALWRHRIGRAVRFAGAVMTSLLVASVVFDHVVLNNAQISTLAAPCLLVAVLCLFGMFTSPSDRSFSTGFVVGVPFSFFILQYKLSFLIDSPDLRSGSALILTIASALAIAIWIFEGGMAWRSRRRIRPSSSVL